MITKGLKCRISLIILIILFSLPSFLYSQNKDSFVKLRGLTEDNMRPAEDVTIRLFENNSLIKEIVTDYTGKFDFKLDTGKYYVVEMYKPGYIKKKIAFDTKVPGKESGIWVNDFAFTLVKECKGVDVSMLEKPMDEIKYDPRSRGFIPDKAYNKNIFKELQNIYFELDQCHQNKYNEILDKADQLYKQDKLNEARNLYIEASEMMPEDQYPRKKMYDIVQELQKRYSDESQYTEVKDKADELFDQGKYEEALSLYNEAKIIKNNDPDLTAKINQANRMIQLENEKKNAARIETDRLVEQKNNQYENLLSQADEYYKNNDYNNAKESYEQALQIKPNDPYIKSRIERLEKLIVKENQEKQLAEQQQKENRYRSLINEGNNLINGKNYELAQQKFEEALLIKPGDIVAQGKLSETKRLLTQQQQQNLAEKEKEQKFNQYVQEANKLMTLGEYPAAKQKYELAQNLKPADVAVQGKINQINQIMSQQQKELAEKEKEKQYEQLIREGNSLINLGEYAVARQKYEQARTIKPNDITAQNKLNQINQLIEQQKQANIAIQQKEQQYGSYISEATNLMNLGEYNAAKQKLEMAKNLKPEDATILNKLNEVNKKIEEQRLADVAKLNEQKKENEYKNNISNADKLLSMGEYDQAKQYYENALTFKPGDSYASTKLNQTNNILLKQKQEDQDRLKKENEYQLAIQKANNLYQLGELNAAKAEFQNALNIKPGDAIAANRIKEIDQQVKQKQQQELIALQQENTYKQHLAKGDDLYKKQNYQDALDAYNEAQKIKPSDKNLISKIEEIESILAKKQADEERLIAYNNAIDLADKYFSKSDYRNAREQYEKALLINPNSVHAKGQLDKIAKMTNMSQPGQTVTVSALPELKFNNDSERQRYLSTLSRKYPAGITLEVYKEKYQTTNRYVIIRNGEANEFREVKHSWGGVDYSVNDRPITALYFKQQTKQREGEYFKQFNK